MCDIFCEKLPGAVRKFNKFQQQVPTLKWPINKIGELQNFCNFYLVFIMQIRPRRINIRRWKWRVVSRSKFSVCIWHWQSNIIHFSLPLDQSGYKIWKKVKKKSNDKLTIQLKLFVLVRISMKDIHIARGCFVEPISIGF